MGSSPNLYFAKVIKDDLCSKYKQNRNKVLTVSSGFQLRPKPETNYGLVLFTLKIINKAWATCAALFAILFSYCTITLSVLYLLIIQCFNINNAQGSSCRSSPCFNLFQTYLWYFCSILFRLLMISRWKMLSVQNMSPCSIAS